MDTLLKKLENFLHVKLSSFLELLTQKWFAILGQHRMDRPNAGFSDLRESSDLPARPTAPGPSNLINRDMQTTSLPGSSKSGTAAVQKAIFGQARH